MSGPTSPTTTRPEDGADQVGTGPDAHAALLLDADRVSALVGRPVRAVALRRKPGLSTSAALLAADAPAGAPTVLGWVRALLPAHRAKLAKAQALAARRGRSVHVRRVDGPTPEEDLLVAWGPIATDPRLIRPLDRLTRVVPDLIGDPRAHVLRYNPLRRLVLRLGPDHPDSVVVRVTAHPGTAQTRAARLLAGRGVPVLAPVRGPGLPEGLHGSRRVSVWPWVSGPGDLSVTGDLAQGAAAGAALAALHAASADLTGVADLGLPRYDRRHLADQRVTLVRAVGSLDAGLGARAAALLAAAPAPEPGHRPVLVHGDFSADQVLATGAADSTQVTLLDLDRLGVGDPAQDLGSFVASELLRTDGRDPGLGEAVLRGHSADADATTDAVLRPWVAHALVTRLVEPFREGRADWRDGIAHRLDLLEQVLTR